MENIKFKDYVTMVDEMAKAVPPGSVVKCMTTNDSAIYSGGWSGHSFQSNLRSLPAVFNGAGQGYYIMKVEKSSSKFIEGTILFTNGLSGNYVNYKCRFLYKDAVTAGKEYDILIDKQKEIGAIIGKTSYVEGTDSHILDHAGKHKTVREGEYVAKSVNFNLTKEFDEPVIVYFSKDDENFSFSIKLSDVTKMMSELTKEQKKEVAGFISKKLGMTIDYDKDYDRYRVKAYNVRSEASKSNGWMFSGQFGPFKSKTDAENYMKTLGKDETMACKPEFKVTETYDDSKLETLLLMSKNFGEEIKMKDVLHRVRGAVAASEYGV